MKKEFLPFEEARTFVRCLNLKSFKDWKKYCKSGNKPINIPSCPHVIYKNDWISWGDWIGTFSVHTKEFLPFEEARNFVYTKNLKNQAEWWIYCKSGNKPDNVPCSPDIIYKNNGWNGWYDWFGYDKISVLKNNFIIKANIVHNNKFDYSKVNYINVKNKVIIGCPIHGDFEQTINGHLNGRGCSKCAKIDYRSFENARNFVHSLNLQTNAEWIIFNKSENMPKDIPHNPNVVYKDNGWISIGDWLGTNSIAPQYMKYRTFEEAKIFAQKQNLKSKDEWKVFKKSENFPIDIPKNPNVTYKDNGWISWGDFLGTFTLAPKNISKNYLSEEAAKQFLIANFSDVHPDDMDDAYEKWWNNNQPINLPKHIKLHYKLFY
jgi:hypothetical protein